MLRPSKTGRRLSRCLDALLTALSYFTILPVGARRAPTGGALAALPLVGALVGALAGALACLIAAFAAHPLVVATAFGASIVLTGAIHIDGFLDSCDALFASVPPQRRLEILKDPRHGTFALAGFAVIAALWVAALWSLPVARLVPSLAFSAALARWSAVANALFLPHARAGAPSAVILAVEGMALLLAAAFFQSYLGLMLVALALGGSLIGGQLIKRCLGGGITGDGYGFLIVLIEVAVLVALGATQRLASL